MVSVEMNNIPKTISIPSWYRYGFFWQFHSKNNPTDVLSPFYESDICWLAGVLSKTAKKSKKPYLYQTSKDMVSVEMNKISKTISIP